MSQTANGGPARLARKGAVFVVFALSLIALPFVVRHVPLRLNTTPSLPIGLYALTRCSPQRGQIVVHTLPQAAMAFAKARGYLGRNARGFLKPIAGMPGDEVCWIGQDVLINGTNAATLSVQDHLNRPLTAPTGCVTLEADQVLPLIQDNPNSFDDDIQFRETPVLYNRTDGGDLALVNYRVNMPYYIVDGLMDEIVLKRGERSRDEIRITRRRSVE